jgi:hypothetical protein
MEWDEDEWVNLLVIMCIILQNTNKNTKTRGMDYDTGLAVIHLEISCFLGLEIILYYQNFSRMLT